MGELAADLKDGSVEPCLAVGETVILMTPPFLSLLKQLLKAEGEAAD